MFLHKLGQHRVLSFKPVLLLIGSRGGGWECGVRMLYHINPRTNLVNFSLLLEIFTSLRILCAFVHAWFFLTWFREKYSITSKIIWNYQWYEIDFTTSPVVFLRSEGGEVNLLRVIRIWKLIWTLLKRKRYFKKDERNWVPVTNSDFLIPIYLKRDVVIFQTI